MPRSLRRIAACSALVLAAGVGVGTNDAFAAPDAPKDGSVATPDLPGLSRLLDVGATGVGRAIATFDSVPAKDLVDRLRALGLKVQPMRNVPLAVVVGDVRVLKRAVQLGLANDLYPDERLELLDTRSSDAMGAKIPRTNGYTGKGVTVAVVDSGCDASHPDLAQRVKHNVKLLSPEYVNGAPDQGNTVVVPVEQGPYQNTDIGSGHGTHVAGIIAADGHTGRDHRGVAPAANLVCYGIGEVLFTTAVVTAYDHMLDQPNLWGIDVVNNSWGNSFRQFDPRDPVHVVTKAVADQGVSVVFAAGNSGTEKVEASLNPFSLAPWVTSVAAGTIGHQRGDFSSNGYAVDNAQATQIGGGGHTTWYGDRIGTYHPDVTAPGVDISSTCATAGSLIGPCPPPDYTNAEASGTSMASPHIAGAIAVLRQANPKLSVYQARYALQATATSLRGEPFWRVGYGYADLDAAVRLVRASDWRQRIAAKQSAAAVRERDGDAFAVRRSDLWTYNSPRLTVGTDTHTFRATVPQGVSHVKVVIAHPSLATLGLNGTKYTVTVRDAAGKVVGTTTEAPLTAGSGTAKVLVDLAKNRAKRGTFSFGVVGDYAVSDPDGLDSDSVLGRMVTVQVAQLVKN